MKIYNKKSFALGVNFAILAIALLVTAKHPIEPKPIILAVLCAVISVSAFWRSLSQKLAKADRLEALDERNRLVTLKANSKTGQITQLGAGILTVFFLGIGAGSGNRDFTALGVSAAFCLTISLFAEMFTRIYYEKHT